MRKEYITPYTDVLEIITEEMIAASGVFSEDNEVDIPFGGDPTKDLDPESRIPFGNFIFGE